MPLQKSLFFQECLFLLERALKTVAEGLPEMQNQLSIPPEFQYGQCAFACHGLSKKMRQSPVAIAEKLQEALLCMQPEWVYVQKIVCMGGYLNFYCAFDAYAKAFFKESEELFFFQTLDSHFKKRRINIEFSQPNTHKRLHVGHMRNMVLGDAIASLLMAVGHDVVRTTYPGDFGTHIAKVLWYIQHQKASPKKEALADWLGSMYVEADIYFKSLNEKERLAVKQAIDQTLKCIQEKKEPFYELYLKTRQWSLDHMQEIYAWLGIVFDRWFFESALDEPSRLLAKALLDQKIFTVSEGAIGIDLSLYDLGFALYLKSDHTGLYLTKDLELLRQKWEDPLLSQMIVLVDARQKLHFKQLFKTCEIVGFAPVEKLLHLSYETVTDETGKAFSSRSNAGLMLGVLQKELEEKITQEHLKEYEGQWSAEEIKTCAQQIALGALKFGFLKVDAQTPIRFILDDWVRLDGDTGPYVQYAHARCCRLLEKIGNFNPNMPVCLEECLEQQLLMLLDQTRGVISLAEQQYRPNFLAGHLLDVAKMFNRFYKACMIRNVSDQKRNTRLGLVFFTRKVLKEGLALLGIQAPQKM